MLGRVLALGISAFSFEPPTSGPAPDSYVCQAYVVRMGPAWCLQEDGTFVICQQIQPSEPVACIVTDFCAQAAHDPLPGEVLGIWIRSMLNGVASPVCTHDGGDNDCGTVELVDEGPPCF